MPYFALPFAVHYCHSQESGNKVLEVTLEGENGDSGSCCCLPRIHLPGILPFQLLGMKPGTSPVSHFFSPSNLLWVPVSISTM
ncbi:hypothetical protein Peur_015397 [Populus x canadensis]